MVKHFSSLLCLYLAGAQAAPSDVVELSLEPLRPVGYTIGDTIEQRVTITLSSQHRLAVTELPPTGRVDSALQRQAVTYDRRVDSSDRPRYRLRLRYQIVNLTAPQQTITLPAVTLPYGDGRSSATLTLPPVTLYAHTIATAVATPLPPQAPPPFDTQPARAATLAALAAALLAWLALLSRWLWRRHRQRQQPFSRAASALRRLPQDEAGLRCGYQRLHGALNETAGGVLLSADLTDFVARHPRFEPLKEELEAFFNASQRLFFQPAKLPTLSWAELQRLCHRCQQVERR